MSRISLPLMTDARSDDRFALRVRTMDDAPLRANTVDVFQIDVGKLCNQACKHCHVDAGPHRTEQMDATTAALCVALMQQQRFAVVDITGGAPELNPHFMMLVDGAVAAGSKVLVRHNLTVQFEPGHASLPQWFAARSVSLVCSLPHYREEATQRQRGKGVFDKSIAALRALNDVGYGSGRADRALDLMYNPGGAFLPGRQADLERDFRNELSSRHGVYFDRLLALANMPIARFRDWLDHTGQLEEYQSLLEGAFNHATLPGLMCRNTISVSWDGLLYDCDFNQMLGMTVRDAPSKLAAFDRDRLSSRRVVTADHCFGCTAGAGSSCGGAVI